jgi:hypothetical protein
MGIITHYGMAHPLVAGRSDGFQRDSRECAAKSSHEPDVLPQFQSSEGGNNSSP